MACCSRKDLAELWMRPGGCAARMPDESLPRSRVSSFHAICLRTSWSCFSGSFSSRTRRRGGAGGHFSCQGLNSLFALLMLAVFCASTRSCIQQLFADWKWLFLTLCFSVNFHSNSWCSKRLRSPWSAVSLYSRVYGLSVCRGSMCSLYVEGLCAICMSRVYVLVGRVKIPSAIRKEQAE